MSTSYEPVIGIEVHARLSTQTKMFCRCQNAPLPELPNMHVCPVCMGFPGMLPVVNEEAITRGIMGALALGCTIRSFTKFDRKNYFYPDLPKGYQISQFDEPIAEHGYVDIETAEGERRITVSRLHLEEDAGKLSHTELGTLCDYNRSGVPLAEIVSGPDMHTVEEASLYAQELQKILRSVGASECDMEKGMMRFDVNISLRPTGTIPFGTKVEIKNLNSFRSLEKSIVYEIARQTSLLEEGQTIVQETRGFDDAKEITVSQRSKEEAADYRYFPEPDLPPLTFTDERIAAYRALLPELPSQRKKRYTTDFSLDADSARMLSSDYALGDFFEALVEETGNLKASVSWVLGPLLQFLNKDNRSITEITFHRPHLVSLIGLVDQGLLSNVQAKEVFEEMYYTGTDPQTIAKAKGFEQVSDVATLLPLCEEVVASSPTQVAAYQGGKDKLFGYFVGEVVKRTQGKASPKVVSELMKKLLGSPTKEV